MAKLNCLHRSYTICSDYYLWLRRWIYNTDPSVIVVEVCRMPDSFRINLPEQRVTTTLVSIAWCCGFALIINTWTHHIFYFRKSISMQFWTCVPKIWNFRRQRQMTFTSLKYHDWIQVYSYADRDTIKSNESSSWFLFIKWGTSARKRALHQKYHHRL